MTLQEIANKYSSKNLSIGFDTTETKYFVFYVTSSEFVYFDTLEDLDQHLQGEN